MKFEQLNSLIHPEVSVKHSVDLSKYSTMRLRAIGTLITCSSLAGLKETLIFLNKNKIPYRVLGWGANQIITDQASWVYLQLSFVFKNAYFDKVRDIYDLPASLPLNIMSGHAKKFGLSGWEVFTGIPATLGGAIYMNAGTRLGEIGELIKSVKVMNIKGELRDEVINSSSFSYRKNNFVKDGEVIISAKVFHKGINNNITKIIQDYSELRHKTQPISKKTCGCVFKNPYPDFAAGKAIELLGLKGFTYKGIEISKVHGNFFENTNEAKTSDFLDLIEFVSQMLERYYAIEFELEVKI